MIYLLLWLALIAGVCRWFSRRIVDHRVSRRVIGARVSLREGPVALGAPWWLP